MNLQTLERIKQRWQFAADSMPQLIFVMDGVGRVLHANRTLKRWGLGEVEWVHGIDLHELMHPRCGDRECYLRDFWQRSAGALTRDRRAECDAWDPVLAKHLQFRIQLPVRGPEQGAAADDFFAVITVDDLTAVRASEDSSRRAAQMLSQRVEREEQRRTQAERLRARLLAILDKTPAFTAMADHAGTLFYLNPAARTLLGIAAEEKLAGLTLVGCVAAAQRLRMAEEAMPAAERGGVWSGDSLLLAHDGREVRNYLTLISHRDESGRLEGYSLMGRDMSEWVRTEEALRVTQNELWRLSAQHLTIQEAERRRIAADLHDGLGQTLSLVKLAIEEAARSAKTGATGKVAATLERLAPTVKLALSELRRMSMNLRPSTLDDLGIVATLSWYFREIEAACSEALVLERDIGVSEADVPNVLKIAIFRTVQEATNNALKHARSGRIRVSLTKRDKALELAIEDDGKGFDLGDAATDFEHGLGLQSMRERAQLSGAQFEIDSAPGRGTRVRVRWTLMPDMERDTAATGESRQTAAVADRSLTQRFSHCLACLKRLAN